jgi:hypothetical protein
MRAILVFAFMTANLLAQDSYGIKVPEGYVLQVLTATDGRIAKPKDWYYTNSGTPSGWMWTFAAEDPQKNGGWYETGLRIQMIMKVTELTKKTRETFAAEFIEQKRKSIKVFSECPVSDLGHFKRRCIEVLESIPTPSGPKTFHILYSVTWLKEMDIVAVSTFGAPESKWNSVADISKVMSEFIIIGSNPGNKD